MTFTQPLEALVLTCFERVYGSRNRIDWLGGKDRRSAFDTERANCLGWYSLYTCEVVFADCSREHFAGDETN